MHENFINRSDLNLFIILISFLSFFIISISSVAGVEIILDDLDVGYSETETWSSYSHPCGYGGDYRYETVAGIQYAAWYPNILAEGNYSVYVHYCVHSQRPDAVPYTVVHADGTDAISVDQTKNAAGSIVADFTASGWKYLGRYRFTNDSSMRVYLDTSDTGDTCADAVKFTTDIHVPDEYSTIQAAIDAASDGDTILVYDGTYNENIVVNKELTIKAASSPIIDGQGMFGPAVHITADNVTFQGFIIRNFTANTTYGIGALLVEGNNSVINYNIIYEITPTGDPINEPAGIGIDVHAKNVQITNNIIHDVGSIGIRVRDNWIAPTGVNNNVLIENNRVYRTNNTGVLVTGYAKDVIIKGNKIYESLEPTPYNVFVHYGSSNVIIEDNYIHDPYNSIYGYNIVLAGCDNITILGNTITNAVSGKNIYILDDYGWGTGTFSTNIRITNNDILNGKWGIRIVYTDTTSGDSSVMASTTTINYNNIYDNTDYGVENTIGTDVNATYNWWGTNTGPFHPTTNPNGTGNNVSDYVDFDPRLILSLNLTSPEDRDYDTRRIWVNASTSIIADKIEYSLDGGRFRSLCRNCDTYNRKKSFSDDNHTLVVRATRGSESDSKTINFFVDTREPKIRRTLPKDGEIVQGTTFYIKYTEDNLVKILLHWKESSAVTYNTTEIGCPAGTNKECTIDINLSSFDGKDINYFFEVQDPVHSVNSSINTITIDNTNPTVTILSPEPKIYPERRIDLTVNVSETVDELEYSVDGGRFRRLCRNCDSYDRIKSFSDCDRTLTVRATDYAGNIGEASINFSVDSTKPKIIEQYPKDKKYTNGSFSVEYTEEKLKNITLYYKGVLELNYQNETKDDCESGRRKECIFNVNLTTYDGGHINYYFIVRDHVSETTSRRIYTEMVDTTIPEITINSPTNSTTYDSRRVLINITVSEDVKLEYSDNGERFRRLCNRCDAYNRTRSFSYDGHELLIRATDNAGNEDYASVIFTVER